MATQRGHDAPILLEQLIEHLKSRVDRLKEIVPVVAVYLYGSYAKGCANHYSDVDLAVVSPALGDDIIGESVMLMNVFEDADKDIFVEPQIYSPDDLEDAEPGTFLYEEVIKKGIRIY